MATTEAGAIQNGSIPAWGFGPGLPAEGAPVTLRIAGGRLLIDGWLQIGEVPRERLQARRQGDGVVLEWAGPDGPCALCVDAHVAGITALNAWLPARRSGHDGATRRWLWTALFLTLGLPLLLVAAFFGFREQIVGAVVATIPVEQEQALADELWKGHSPGLRLIRGTAANRFVEEVGARLAAARPTPYAYRFHLADEGSINAFALPAGYIVVHRGLIEKAGSAEEVAGVLAHEIEHVAQRHSLRAMVQAVGIAALWTVVGGDLGGAAGLWARELAGLHFSREQERAADAGGVERLVAAGIDPRGAALFFERLAREQGGIADGPDFLSIHPASAERAARLAESLRDALSFPPLEFDWETVRASLRR